MNEIRPVPAICGRDHRKIGHGRRDAVTSTMGTEPAAGDPLAADPTSLAPEKDEPAPQVWDDPTPEAHLKIVMQEVRPFDIL